MSRKENWRANRMLHREFPKPNDIAPREDKVDRARLNEMVTWLYQWARDMNEWGQAVRHDIIRIEGAVGFASGDPGDPPDGPPPDNGDGDREPRD